MSKLLHRLILLGIVVLQSIWAQAQIAAPDFQCVTNSVLSWEPATTTPCGPFIAYRVYASTTFEGPYTLLATVADPAQTTFDHADSGSQVWWYYLETELDCAGQPRLSSDTLDNRIPLTGPICAVSVNDNEEVVITWQPSISPEVVGYVVSRNTPMGLVNIDTVYQTTTYTDASVNPEIANETYYVVAIDACFNKSLVEQPHTTMRVTAGQVTPCDPTLTLSWDAYPYFAAGLSHYEVQVALNGGTDYITLSDVQVAANVTRYDFDYTEHPALAAFAGGELCFKVVAVSDDIVPKMARSARVCQTLDVAETLAYIDLVGATFTADNALDLTWQWANATAIAEASVGRTTTVPATATQLPVPPDVPAAETLQDVDYIGQSTGVPRGITYQVTATTTCSEQVQSNALVPVLLRGATTEPGQNLLRWGEYEHERLLTAEYRLVKQWPDGSETTLGIFSAATQSYLDRVAATQVAPLCYYVEATVSLQLLDGRTEQRLARSNTVCIEPQAGIFIPNVFSPTGNNAVFRPELAFRFPEQYLMTIYDRWGGQVFQTTDWRTGWNGAANGRSMPTGTYLYRMQFTFADGHTVERAGGVTLLR